MHNLKENALEIYGRVFAYMNTAVSKKKEWWKQPLVFFVIAIGIVSFLSMAHPVEAAVDLTGYLNRIIAWLLEMIAGFLGKLILAVIDLLIVVSGYNNFIDADVVNTGWVLVRDVANMFYIFIMLVIAFGTMLKLEAYTWTKLLPRLIITAVVVNFSRTIMGVIIDFAQVIMITFVNGYAAAAGGNFAQGFSLDAMFKIKEGITGTNPNFQIVLAYLLATTMLAIALVVVSVFLAILIGRIITIWILVILSPLAFLMGTFPKGQEYYGKWWKQFQNAVIVGPILAFFLWLSLATMSGGNSWGVISGGSALGGRELETKDLQIGAGEAGSIEKVGSFVVSIAMLMIGLQMTQELGVMGSGLASGAASAIKSTATKVARAVAVPAAGVVATGGVGALGAWTLPMMAGAMGLGKKGVGSWKEGKGLMGMAKGYKERAGAYIEEKGLEGKGLGALYGWKYKMGAASELKVKRAKERVEEARGGALAPLEARARYEKERAQEEVGRKQAAAEEAVFEKKEGVRMPVRRKYESQLTDKFAKDYAMLSQGEQVQLLVQLAKKKQKSPQDENAAARFRAIQKLVLTSAWGDDATMNKELSDTYVTGGNGGKNVSKNAQRELMIRSALGKEKGEAITDADIETHQTELAELFNAGIAAFDVGHGQYRDMATYDEERQRWTVTGLQNNGTIDYNEIDNKVRVSNAKAGAGKLSRNAPQSVFDHDIEEVTYFEEGKDDDGRPVQIKKQKQVMKRRTQAPEEYLKDLSPAFGGIDLASLNRRNDVQERMYVDVLQGYLKDNFLADQDGNINATNDLDILYAQLPALIQKSILVAQGKGVKKINGVDITNANNQSVVNIAGEIAAKTATAAGRPSPVLKLTESPEKVFQDYAGALSRGAQHKFSNMTTDNSGAAPAYLAGLSGDIIDSAVKFNALIEQAANKLQGTLGQVRAKNPVLATDISSQLTGIKTAINTELVVDQTSQKNMKDKLGVLIQEVKRALS